MRPTVTVERAAVAAAALALAIVPSMASASTTWSVAHPPYTATDNVPYVPLNAITAISATNVWAVGQDSGSPQIDHWNGASWSRSALPSGPCSVFENGCVLTGVGGDSASDVIAVGNGTLNSNSAAGWVSVPLAFRWNGSGWQPMTIPSSVSSGAMQHVQAFSPTDAWAIGNSFNGSSSVATAVQWNGSAWTEVATPISTTAGLTMNAISGSSSSDIWAVGVTQTGGYHNRKFTSVIMHYDGSAWSQVAAPDNSGLVDVAAVSPTDAWALARDGSVLKWNGTAWTVSTQLGLGNTVIAALSPTDVWVGGVVSLTHYNGTNWTSTPVPAGVNALTGQAVLSPGDIWFAGYYYPSNAVTAPAVLSTSSG
jgi:hypothetical protein